jgi:hypothetical protein
MLNGVTDAKLKKKAKLLADAAISGKKVRKMSAKLTASDADTGMLGLLQQGGHLELTRRVHRDGDIQAPVTRRDCVRRLCVFQRG